jgi:hypothetical protein
LILTSGIVIKRGRKSKNNQRVYIGRILIYENGKEIKIDAPFLLDNRSYDVDLSIVVPAYNEEARLPVMMKDTLAVRTNYESTFAVFGEETSRRQDVEESRASYRQ